MPVERILQQARMGAQMRLARHYVEVVGEANQVYLQGWDNSVSALATFDAERPQIDYWWAWLAEQAEGSDEAARLLVAMTRSGDIILWKRLAPLEMLTWHEHALKAAQRLGDTASAAVHLRGLAVSHFALGNHEQANGLLVQACALAEEFSHWQELADGLLKTGDNRSHTGALDEAQHYCQRALELYQQLGDERGESNGLYQLGWLAVNKGEWSKANDYLQEAYAIALRIGDLGELALDMQMLGVVVHKLGNHAEAARYRMQALEISQRLGDQRGTINIMMSVAVSHDSEGNYTAARELYLQTLSIAKRAGSRRYEAGILGNLGFSSYLAGSYDDAIRCMEESITMFRADEGFYNMCVILANLVPAYLHQGMYQQARDVLQEGLKLAVEIAAEPLKATMVVAAVQTWGASAEAQDDPAAQREMMEYAAYWSGLILVCPGAEQENRDEIEKLRPAMEDTLGVERFQDLLKQGGQIYIDDVIAEILGVLKGEV